MKTPNVTEIDRGGVDPMLRERGLSICSAIGAALAAYGLWIIYRSYSPLIYSDYWSTIPLYQAWLRGTLTLHDMHSQLNEHRILVPRVFYLIDYAAFSGNQVFAFGTILALDLAHAVLLSWMVAQSSSSRAATVAFAMLCVALMLSPAQYENLTWGFEIAWMLVYLFATAAFACLAAMQHSAPGAGSHWKDALWFLACCLSGLICTYSMANGVIVWPILLAMSLMLRLPRAYNVLLLVVGATVTGVYMSGLRTSGVYNDYGDVLADPLAYLHFVTHYLAVPFKYIGDIPKILIGGAVLIITVATGLRVLIRPSAYSRWQIVFVAVAGFVLAAALITALGRVGYFGVDKGVSKRYSTPAIVLYLALFGFHVSGALARLKQGAGNPAIVRRLIALMAVVTIAAAAVYQSRLERWIDKVAGREKAILAYVAGARSADLLDLTGREWHLERFRRDVDFLRAQRVSIFADPLYALDPPSHVGPAEGVPDCAVSLLRYTSDPQAGTEIAADIGSAKFGTEPGWLIATDGNGSRLAYGLPAHAMHEDGRTMAIAFGPAAERPAAVGFAYVTADSRVVCTGTGLPLP